MYKPLLLWLLLSSCATAQNTRTQHWQYIGQGGRAELKKVLGVDKTFIPFVDVAIHSNLLDSLTSLAPAHDSLLALYAKGCAECLPKPVIASINGKALLYVATFAAEKGGSSYKLYSFYISNTDVINEHDCIAFYYVPSVGVVAAFHKVADEWHILRNYDRYLLTRVSARGGETIPPEKLQSVISAALEACECRL